MTLTAADQAAIIAALGETVTVNGATVTGDFRLESQPVQLYDGSVMSGAPSLRITAADHAARSVDYGSAITARGVSYTVVEIRQEQAGLYLLTLTKV